MRVMCIRDFTGQPLPVPVFGETYNVIDEQEFPEGLYYQLEEFPPVNSAIDWFAARCFVPLSHGETEAMEEVEKVEEPMLLSFDFNRPVNDSCF